MKLTAFQLRNFTVFDQADLELASGINVLIGENGTGKSHILKALYALIRGVRERVPDKREAARYQGERLGEVFKIGDDDPSRLVRMGCEDDGATLLLRAEHGETRCTIDASGALELSVQAWQSVPEALFLPARDVLAMYEGFVPIYERQRISFDETYRDICLALGQPALRGSAKAAADALSAPFQAALGGDITLEDGRFYVDFGTGKHEAQLVAEGLRKLGALAHLTGNGSIRPGGVLLWDEPEANMNPRLIARMVKVLHGLAAQGVQIILATHDYLLSHKLSMIAEYELEPRVDIRFFALHHESPIAPVQVEAAASLAHIQNNAILDEYAEHHDEQRERYRASLRADLAEEER